MKRSNFVFLRGKYFLAVKIEIFRCMEKGQVLKFQLIGQCILFSVTTLLVMKQSNFVLLRGKYFLAVKIEIFRSSPHYCTCVVTMLLIKTVNFVLFYFKPTILADKSGVCSHV